MRYFRLGRAISSARDDSEAIKPAERLAANDPMSEGIYKLRLNPRKTVEAIDWLARQWPGITQYYVGKTLYFADRDHCLDWGRTITGDRYVAMEHGPVPSRIYDLLKSGSGEDDELLGHMSDRLALESEGNKVKVYSKQVDGLPSLSESDVEALAGALKFCRNLTFSQLRDISHAELPWAKAHHDESAAPPMDLRLWFEQAGIDSDVAEESLREHAKFGVSN